MPRPRSVIWDTSRTERISPRPLPYGRELSQPAILDSQLVICKRDKFFPVFSRFRADGGEPRFSRSTGRGHLPRSRLHTNAWDIHVGPDRSAAGPASFRNVAGIVQSISGHRSVYLGPTVTAHPARPGHPPPITPPDRPDPPVRPARGPSIPESGPPNPHIRTRTISPKKKSCGSSQDRLNFVDYPSFQDGVVNQRGRPVDAPNKSLRPDRTERLAGTLQHPHQRGIMTGHSPETARSEQLPAGS